MDFFLYRERHPYIIYLRKALEEGYIREIYALLKKNNKNSGFVEKGPKKRKKGKTSKFFSSKCHPKVSN